MKSLFTKSAMLVAFLFTSLFVADTFAATAYTIRTNPGIKNSVSVTWSALSSATATAATPYKSANFLDQVVQVGGTIGTASLNFQGSNDGVTYYTLLDSTGSAMTFSASGIKKIGQNALYIKPVVSGGTTSSINVDLHSK